MSSPGTVACRRARRGAFALLAALAAPATSVAADEASWDVVARWRHEAHDTLSSDAARDDDYSFGQIRLRLGGTAGWGRVSVRGVLQGAAAYSLPDDASFGLGRVYFEASGSDDSSPSLLDVAEAFVTFDATERTSVVFGRHGIREGRETAETDARLQWLENARLSERLVGTWDWVNVGRRFDGAGVTHDADSWTYSGFFARVLEGGVDYDDAFNPLDEVYASGASATARAGTVIDGGELRLFAVHVRDARAVTASMLGDAISVASLGASVTRVHRTDGGTSDLMAWGTAQLGDFGALDHSAYAAIVEGGYQWTQAAWAPWLRGGVAWSSGDGNDADGDHDTFFNMVPTNHKFYGSQDLNALQNLTDAYVELRLAPCARLALALEGHVFRRSDPDDAWYGGSGPANNETFGYVARVPGNRSRDIGTEVDLTATWDAGHGVSVMVGASRFSGGDVAEAVFPVESDFTWFFAQATYRRSSHR